MTLTSTPASTANGVAGGLRRGDRVELCVDGHRVGATVGAFEPGVFIALRGDDGRGWIDVVFGKSAAEWTRLVELAVQSDPDDGPSMGAIAGAVAYLPDRRDVRGVNGAERLCDHGTALSWQ